LDAIYQPALPDRFDDEAVAKLSPSDPARTLVNLHKSIQPLAQKIEDARAAIDNDPKLSPQGKLDAKQAVFAEHVGGTIQAHAQPLRLAGLRVAEQSQRLIDDAVKGATVSENRMLTHAAWLRDLDPDVRGRVVLAAIADGDPETMAAILSAPRIWNIATAAQKERAAAALAALHDPERAALLADVRMLVQSLHESHESLARHGRKVLDIGMLPAKGVSGT
jgi:hypothetical protein